MSCDGVFKGIQQVYKRLVYAQINKICSYHPAECVHVQETGGITCRACPVGFIQKRKVSLKDGSRS